MTTTLPSIDALAPGLDRDELLTRLETALAFACRNIEQLDRNSEFWDDDDSGSRDYLTDKIIAETALLAFIASRVQDLPKRVQTTIAGLAEQLSPLARSERVRVMLMRFPHTAVTLASAHVYLSCLGNRDEAFDYLWFRALASGQVEAVERLPYRALDVRWLRNLAQGDMRADFGDLLPYTTMVSRAHPIYMTREDAYALTHALMYVTDFGVRRLPASLNLGRIRAMIDAGLAWHIMSEDVDLLGELLIGAAVLRQPWSPYAQFAWQMLARTWDELGFLPGPNFKAHEYASLAGDEASAYALKHLYHTNYVGGLLCAVLLSHPENSSNASLWTVPSQTYPNLISRCEQAVTLAAAFCEKQGLHPSALRDAERLSSIDVTKTSSCADNDLSNIMARAIKCSGQNGSSEARWSQVLEDVPLSNDALALVLSDAVLIQAARTYELAMLVGALVDVVHLSLPPSITFVEATHFLTHQQHPSGAIGAHFTKEENLSAPSAAVITASFAGCLAAATQRLTELAPAAVPASRIK